ncbi:MAG: tyrosine-type recombinase/integrase, partial [Pigmentiphaga sp.]
MTQNQTLRFERPENVPLETILVRYYEGHGKHIASREQALYACRKLSEFFPGLLVSELTPDRLDAFVQWMRDKRLSDGYISRTLSTLKAALNRAYKRQEVQRVPFVPLPRGGEPRDRRLSLAESAALFDACGTEHLLLYLVLAFGTLARPSALLELRRSQIDFENRLINLNQPGRQQTKKYRPALPMA